MLSLRLSHDVLDRDHCDYDITTDTNVSTGDRDTVNSRLKIIVCVPTLLTLLSCLSFRSVCLWDRDALLAAIADHWESEVTLRLASRKQGLLPLNCHVKFIKR